MTFKEAAKKLETVEKIACHAKNGFQNAFAYAEINDVLAEMIKRMYNEAQIVADFTLFEEEEPNE